MDGILSAQHAAIELQGAAKAGRLLGELERGASADGARKFEELFASILVKELRKGLPQGFFGQGAGADVFEGWLDEHIGRSIASGRGLGIASIVQRELEAGIESAGKGLP
jgi:Rod binding domain-containing protein